jgi:hypothetical protein
MELATLVPRLANVQSLIASPLLVQERIARSPRFRLIILKELVFTKALPEWPHELIDSCPSKKSAELMLLG